MASSKPYIGCRISLISKAQNRYEGILYTIDRTTSTIVLAEVRCLGTEGRPTDRPTAPKDDVYEYITFRGSDIKDMTMCEPPVSQHGLPPDPAIIQTSSAGSSGIFSGLGPFSPLRMSAYNQLAASSLLNQQYAAALSLGPLLSGLHVRRGTMVEKAVQTVSVKRFRQRKVLTISQQQEEEQEQQWDRRRPQRIRGATRRVTGATMQASLGAPSSQQDARQQNVEQKLPIRKRQAGPRRRRIRTRGQLIVANVPAPTLRFDTDFDFDSSNAQFNKEELESNVQGRTNLKDENHEEKEMEGLQPTSEDDHFGPKFYYDKAKSFFDNISSGNGLRLTWAEERKRNLETFGASGRFLGGQGFRGGYNRRRGRGGDRL